MKMAPMGIQSMKVHPLGRGFSWEHEPPYLTLTCTKRLRPFSSTTADTVSGSFDLKSFIRPGSGPRKIIGSSSDSSTQKKEPVAPVETQPGGTRWNPTQEQIGILEMLYRGGMRTPNAQQIEHITSQLANYGKIEGKNVFYWFQNHKARERQKQKRTSLGLNRSPRTPPSPFSATTNATTTTTSLLLSPDTVHTKGDGVEEVSDGTPYKRKCSTWAFEQFYEETNVHCTENERRDGEDRTLKLFPLHPEGRSNHV